MTGAASIALLAGCLTACRPARPPAPADPPVPLAFDHVIVAIDSFARGVELLRAATGVVPLMIGADHVALTNGGEGGRGTQSALLANESGKQSALIGLGDGRYLELVGPSAAGLARPETREAFAIYRQLEPIAWGARTPNAAGLRDSMLAGRRRPGALHSGTREVAGVGALRWRTLTPWANVSTIYPVLIEWDRTSTHPSAAAPAGCTLVAFTLGNPYDDSMREALARAGVHTTIVPTAKYDMDLTLDCPTGEVRLPARAVASGSGR
jgi:hypothetical protein